MSSITTAEAKTHLRVTTSDDDTYIAALITAAEDYAQIFTRRSFLTQNRTLKLNQFPSGMIEIPYPPLRSITAIQYVDEDGTTQTMSSSMYVVDTYHEPGRVTLAYGQSWPATRLIENVVTVTYSAGYGEAASVPEGIKAALKLLVGLWYEQRLPINVGNIINQLPMSVRTLLWRYRATVEL